MRIGSAKVRALLSRLVLAGERPIPADRVVRAVWGEAPPRTAEHAVQVHVSKLRALVRDAGGNLPLKSTAAGYQLAGPGVRVDAIEFERELADGRAALLGGDLHTAADLLERARARWRGVPYPDLADDLVVDPDTAAERARLTILRLDADEEWAETCLALGRHQELVPVLDAAIAEEPLRERRYQQLMVALYGAGRTAEALDVYQQARTTLVEQLGIEPGPLLRDAEQAVLNHDPSRFPGPAERAGAATLARPPDATGRFVGRLDEWSHLSGLVSAAGTGTGRVVLVGGPPGIGKSRLVTEVAASTGPFSVARGACPEGGSAPPLWPVVEALRDLGPAALPTDANGLDDHILAPLRETVEGRLSPAAASAALPDDEHAAFRLHDAVAELLVVISRRRPLVLVLDDLHRTDAATMGVVNRLAQRIGAERIIVLATHRDTPADHTEAFAAGSASLVRQPSVEQLSLGPLGADEVASYVTAAGLDAERLTDALLRRTDGSPLLLTEIVGLLVTRDGDPAALAEIPDGLSAVLDARLGDLGPARPVIERAAVIGPRFTVDTLARIADVGSDLLLDALTAGARLGLVDDTGGGSRRFRHVLIAEAAAASVPESDRARLHLRIADVLERTRSLDEALTVTEAARHRVAALPMGDPSTAAASCLAAAELSHLALADAETVWFAGAARRALDLADDPDPLVSARALALEGEARTVSGQDARPLLEAAVAEARRTGDPVVFAQAVQALALNRSTAASAGDAEFAALCEEAIGGLAGRGGWLPVQIAVDLAMTYYRTPDWSRARELTADALERARADGDPVALAFALTGFHQAISDAATAARRADVASEAIHAAQSCGLEWHESLATSFRGNDRWELGDLDGAAADFERALALAQRGRRARFVWIARSWQALLAAYHGDLVTAERLRVAALEAWGPAPNPDAVLCDLGQRMMLATIAGDVGEFIPIVRYQAETDAEPLFWQTLIALLHAQQLPDDAARRTTCDAIDVVLAAGLDQLLPTVTHLPALAFLAEAAARAGHVDAARAVLPELEPYAGTHVVMNVYGGGGLCWGVADQGLALAAATSGDRDAAVAWQRSTGELLTATSGTTFLRRSRALASLVGIG